MTPSSKTTKSWTIRRGLPTDGAELLRVHSSAILASHGRSYSQEQLESWVDGLLAERYAEAMTNGEEGFLVAISGDGTVIGFCSHHDDRVIGLYVDPDWSGRGIGSTLLRAAESSIAEQGHRECGLEAALPAVTFYESLGYRRVGERDVTTRGGLFVRVFDMTRHLR